MSDLFTWEDLKEILTGRVGMEPDEVPDDPSTTLAACDVDSLAVMEIQLELEQRYGFDVNEEEAATIKTFTDIVTYVQNKQGGGS